MNLSIVIPVRKEPRLQATIRQIDRTCPKGKPEIILVFDGEPCPPKTLLYSGELKTLTTGKERVGTSAARNRGVFTATREYIFTCDGHMGFLPNDWAGIIESTLKRTPTSVLCCRCAHLTAETPTFETSPKASNAARIHWKQEVKEGENRALSARWHTNSIGEIGAVMGAAYAFSKSWYIYGLAAPWAGAAGWGMDEEVLSITNWLCGGTNQLLDVVVGHWFGKATRGAPLTFGRDGVVDVWATRLRVIDILPMAKADREELIGFVKESGAYQKYSQLIDARLTWMNPSRLRTHLKGQSRTFEDYKKEWIVGTTPTKGGISINQRGKEGVGSKKDVDNTG